MARADSLASVATLASVPRYELRVRAHGAGMQGYVRALNDTVGAEQQPAATRRDGSPFSGLACR